MIAGIKTAPPMAIAILFVLAATSLFAQTDIPPSPAPYPYQRPLTQAESWRWASEKWTGDNAPYKMARTVIEAKPKEALASAYAAYKTAALKNPNDTLLVFRWGYTAYLLTKQQKKEQGYKTLNGLHDAFEDAPSPHVYDYDRLRFLVEEWYTSNREATEMGQRLLTMDKDDYDVEYRLADIYLYVCNPPRIAEAIALTDRMKRADPSRASIYSLIGFAHVAKYHYSHAASDAQAVVENYKKYLALATPDDEFRKRAQQIIKEYQKKE